MLQNMKVVDIFLRPSKPKDYTDKLGFPLHSCIMLAPYLITIKLRVAYSCGYCCTSKYLQLTAEDLASLACCKSLRHFEVSMVNRSDSYTDPEDTFYAMKGELQSFADLRLDKVWPNLETLMWDMDTYGDDIGITPNIQYLPKNCMTLSTSLHAEQLSFIPATITDLDLDVTELSDQSIIRLSMSPAFQGDNLFSFTSKHYRGNISSLLPVLPSSLTSLQFNSLVKHVRADIDGLSPLRRLHNLTRLHLGYTSLEDSLFPGLSCLKDLPSLKMVQVNCIIGFHQVSWEEWRAISHLEMYRNLQTFGLSGIKLFID